MSFNPDYNNLFRFTGGVFIRKSYFCSSVLQELRENPFSNSICMGEFL